MTQRHALRRVTFSSRAFEKETARQGSGSRPGPQLALVRGNIRTSVQSPTECIEWTLVVCSKGGWAEIHIWRQRGFLHRKPATVGQWRMMRFACVLYKPRRGATTSHWYLNWSGIMCWSRSGRFGSKFIVKREWSLQRPSKEENSGNPG